MAFGMVGFQADRSFIGLQRILDLTLAALHQPQVVPGKGHFRSTLARCCGQLNGLIDLVGLEQQGGQIQPGAKAKTDIQSFR